MFSSSLTRDGTFPPNARKAVLALRDFSFQFTFQLEGLCNL